MLEQFSLANFKSFQRAELRLDSEFTIVIGPNASGKSNLLEGLKILSWLARGPRLHDLQTANLARGSAKELFLDEKKVLHFTATVAGGQELGPLELDLAMTYAANRPELRISAESLRARDLESSAPLYEASKGLEPLSNDLIVKYNNFDRGGRKPQIVCVDQQAVFTQLLTPARFEAKHVRSQQVIPLAAETLQFALESTLFLDAKPAAMRDYVNEFDSPLKEDGRNVSAIVKSLCEQNLKPEILEFVQALPEQRIADINFITTERHDVMLRLLESFGGQHLWRDAAVLSDGTLRVLAIAAALLSAPSGSLVVIEELDNGVHPSRAQKLVERIRTVAKQQGIRVLITTHNPALMSAVPAEALEDVVVSYRGDDGSSRLIRLGDVPHYPALVAQGSLGDLATRGLIEQYIKAPPKEYDHKAFLEMLKVAEGS